MAHLKKYFAISCGTIDSAVASNTRGLVFESTHRELLLKNYLLLTVFRKTKIKNQRGQELYIFRNSAKEYPDTSYHRFKTQQFHICCAKKTSKR